MTLLDIRMAGGDGLEALVALKEEHPRMAVVMLTTYDNPTYIYRAVAGGASDTWSAKSGKDAFLVNDKDSY